MNIREQIEDLNYEINVLETYDLEHINNEFQMFEELGLEPIEMDEIDEMIKDRLAQIESIKDESER
ncbi:MAG: hypothetical protein VX468_02365, partial [Pseudomonadota bacterium]|nr:hypothetical protein [Pseudomonadota bacterium]